MFCAQHLGLKRPFSLLQPSLQLGTNFHLILGVVPDVWETGPTSGHNGFSSVRKILSTDSQMLRKTADGCAKVRVARCERRLETRVAPLSPTEDWCPLRTESQW